ncbi:MAG TPA: hypothetical protein VK488_03880 [Gaiellaceae bacterium]|nr:hypothetical protein [Gaiellaceae bacterium]
MSVRVGIRDLRERMSYWLGRAADGEELIVTRHDEPIARITNIDGRTTLDRLIEEGLVTPAKREKRKIRIEDLIPARGSVSELLIEDRKRGF